MPPNQSRDLQELRRLLRAGFKIEKVILKAGHTEDEADTEFEITKTTSGDRAMFRLEPGGARSGSQPGITSWTLANDVLRTEVHLRAHGGVERVLQSRERDVWDYAITVHPSLDHNGERILRRFRDQSRQLEDAKHLVTLTLDKDKRNHYLRQSIGSYGRRIDGRLKTLLTEYLRTRDWGDARYLPLKTKYFELQQVLLHEAKALMESKRRITTKNPHARTYSELVDDLLNAFWQQDEGFVRRSVKFVSLVRFDVLDAIDRAVEQRRHVDDLLGMLAARGPIPGRQGIPHLMDVYRRYCEALRPFIDVLGDMACAVEKRPPLSPNLGYRKRVAAIKATRFGAIVRCLDPDIRHSESHNGTVIDDDRANVLLTEIGEDGRRRALGNYSYWQISDMTLELQNGLFLTVLTSFALHETGMLVTAVSTPEFISALVSIDNLAD